MDKWVIKVPRLPPNPNHEPTQHSPPSTSTLAAKSSSSSSRPSIRGDIEVVVPAYRPADIPPLQPLTITLPNDSTAYIIDESFQTRPGVAADGKPYPAKRGYWIGWRDLPGASISVGADKVLEYVSPYALEEWEYARWKQRREEKRLTEEAAEKKKKTPKGALKPDTETERKIGRPPKKRPGRPRKAPAIPVDDAVIEEEIKRRSKDQPKEHQPSLSTPKKPRTIGLANTGDEGEEAAIYQQLYGETTSEASLPMVSENEELLVSDYEPPRKRMRSSSPFKSSRLGTPTPKAKPSGLLTQQPPSITSFTPVRQDSIVATSSDSHAASAGILSSTVRKRTADERKTPPTSKAKNGTAKQAQAKKLGDDAQFAVKRLEGTREFIIKGKPVRHYLVRWEGDWPPDQNPTWEPEENVPSSLVRKFLRKNGMMGLDGQMDDPWPERRYSSVTEVFEDPVLENTGQENGEVDSSEEDDEMVEETFQVTERGTTSRESPPMAAITSDIFNRRHGVF